jgi:flagellar basal body rod protein FlgF
METNRYEYQKKIEAQLDAWEHRLEAFRAKANEAGAAAKKGLHEQLDELRALQAPAKKYLDQVRTTSERAWNDVRGELEEAWMKLSVAIESAWKRVTA